MAEPSRAASAAVSFFRTPRLERLKQPKQVKQPEHAVFQDRAAGLGRARNNGDLCGKWTEFLTLSRNATSVARNFFFLSPCRTTRRAIDMGA